MPSLLCPESLFSRPSVLVIFPSYPCIPAQSSLPFVLLITFTLRRERKRTKRKKKESPRRKKGVTVTKSGSFPVQLRPHTELVLGRVSSWLGLDRRRRKSCILYSKAARRQEGPYQVNRRAEEGRGEKRAGRGRGFRSAESLRRQADGLWPKQGDPREIERDTNYGEEKPSGTVLGVVYTIVEMRGGGWGGMCVYVQYTDSGDGVP